MRAINLQLPVLLAAMLAGTASAQILRPPGNRGPVIPQPVPAAPQQPAAQPRPAPTGPPSIYGGISLNNVSLAEVIDMLARQLKINYILDPRVKGGVVLNTYGETKNIDTRSLLEAILRINGAGMVKEGDLYRIVPLSDISHHPLPPERATEPENIKDDDQIMLNLVFLKFVTSTELMKVLQPFVGENASIYEYAPANLLLILDSRRNIHRLMELVAMFDSDALTNQRVHVFEIKHGRPSDISKELEAIVKSISLSEKSPIKFLPIDRINTIMAVAPNPGAFKEVEKWLEKLDVPAKSRAGISNYVYHVHYGDAQAIACSITALYASTYSPLNGGGGSMARCMAMSGAGQYGAGYGGGLGMGGGFGGGFGGGLGGGMYGGGMGGGFYGGGYGGGGMYGGGYGAGYGGGYGGGAFEQGYAGGNPFNASGTPTGTPLPGAAGGTQPGTTGNDLTGSYLGNAAAGSFQAHVPRVVANPFNNTLLILATSQEYDNILSLLKDLDIPPRQVLIEAKIYSVDLTHTLSAGTNLQVKQASGANTAHSLVGDFGVTNPGASLAASALVGKSRELLAAVQLQESENKAKLLQEPSVIATDSIPATIMVGGSVPAQTGSAISGVSGTVATAITNVSTGVGLNIVARVTPSGVVTMLISQTVNDVAPSGASSGSSIDSPSFDTKSVSTQITVQDGDTIAIGGIINETTNMTTSGIPLLNRIPFLGAAFGSKSYSKDRTELIIFITPHVIYDSNQLSDASEELKGRVKLLRREVKE